MTYSVSTLSIVFIIIAMFAGVFIPVALLLYFRAKKKADISPFFIGCAVFFLFSMILESLAQLALKKSSVYAPLQNNIWIYALVMALFAGVFEEAGRFTAFTTVLKKKRGKDVNALMYGAGHGGFEVFMLLAFGMTVNLIYALLIKAGKADAFIANLPATSQDVYKTAFKTLTDTAPGMYLVGITERVSAIILHLSLSVLVWFSAKYKKVFWLFPAAVGIHTLVDMFAVALPKLDVDTFVIECIVFLCAGLCAIFALGVWRKFAVPFVPAKTAFGPGDINAVYEIPGPDKGFGQLEETEFQETETQETETDKPIE